MRRLRAARDLCQEALAHECGINRTYLSSVERSERNVSIDNIARIAKGLQIEPWRLLKENEGLDEPSPCLLPNWTQDFHPAGYSQ